MEGRFKKTQRRLFEVKNKLRRVEEEMERMKKEGERRENGWKNWKDITEISQAKGRRDRKAMEERIKKLEEKMVGGERKKSEEMEYGDWSE